MTEYISEHTFAGRLGDALVAVSLAAVLLSALAYILAHYRKSDSHKILGRWAFMVHSAALVGLAGTLFYMLFNKYFEYDYVWKHANTDMPLRYIFSCFWEGQEGSFILWSIWTMVLGNVLMRTSRSFEPLAMAVVALFQAMIGTMILGIYIGDLQIGSSPFVLIRELPENIGQMWTLLPNYLELDGTFQQGRGLNPLLQNYWMTIHPPTLFLGYASVLFPFALAMAGLWSGRSKEWLRPAIPWAYFSIAVLGLGILMGGAWAYEALSFGGFWAWDPVENASLIPWILIVGAAHMMVIFQRKDRYLYLATVLTLLSFVLVMYASFLVHSGVLGDTSVHSFTGNGLMRQHLFILLSLVFSSVLLLLPSAYLRRLYLLASAVLLGTGLALGLEVAALVAFIGTSAVLAIVAYTGYRTPNKKEEGLWSREFWILMGSLVLMLSALQIGLETSKPVWNILAEPFSKPLSWMGNALNSEDLLALADGKLAPKSDLIAYFNSWQVSFAIFISLLIAFTQYLRYGSTRFGAFAKKISGSLAVAVAITAIIAWAYNFGLGNKFELALLTLLFTSVFAVVANANYFVNIIKGKLNPAGASIAHVGFGMVLLGALISTGRSEKISENTTRFDIERLNENFKNNEDILLFLNDTVRMGPYFVSYNGRAQDGVNMNYHISYYDQKPRTIAAGELTIARGAVFRALNDHTPGPDFVMDQHQWQLVEDPRELDLENISRWSPVKPGAHLFDLKPKIQLNPTFGNVPEPATKRYWNRDIYTHVRWAELETDTNEAGFRTPVELKLGIGDTAFLGATMIRLNALAVVRDSEREEYMVGRNDLAVRAVIGIQNSRGERFTAQPLYILRDSVMHIPDPVIQQEAGLQLSFDRIDPVSGKHTFQVAEHYTNRKEFIVLQAIQFPMINILWIGCILMFLGTGMAVRHRIQISKLAPQGSLSAAAQARAFREERYGVPVPDYSTEDPTKPEPHKEPIEQ